MSYEDEIDPDDYHWCEPGTCKFVIGQKMVYHEIRKRMEPTNHYVTACRVCGWGLQIQEEFMEVWLNEG